MKLEILNTYYTVSVREVLDSPDPDDVGWIDMARCEIQLRSDLNLASAQRTLAHEFVHACVGTDVVPYTPEGFCVKAAPILVEFHRQFIRVGGLPALAQLMGVPFEGDLRALTEAGVSLSDLSGGELQAAVIRWVMCAELTDDQFQSYRARYEAANLNPLLGDCYPRVSLNHHADRLTVELGTTLKALRRIADRTGVRGPVGDWEWCGEDGVWREKWLRSWGPPTCARCYVTRTDFPGEKFHGVANWEAYAQFTEIDGVKIYAPFWERMPEHMLAKCAESLAYARAFTQCDGLYIAESIPIDLRLPARQRARRGNAFPEMDGQFKQTLSNMRSQVTGVAIEEPAVAVQDERPMPTGRIAQLHREMANAGLRDEAKRCEIIEYIRDKAGALEDDNPDAFGVAVMDELRRRRR